MTSLKCFLVALVGLMLAAAAPAFAADTLSDEEALEAAKDDFRQGTALLDAGDLERALEMFLKSRARLASAPNTKNAAYCYVQLGRLDEALPLYEELLTRFGEDVGPEAKAQLAPTMSELRRKLGAVDVASNVEGTLVVDGRARGQLPLFAPLRVMPGVRSLRVIKDGYESFEQTVEVAAGQTLSVDAKLAPLRKTGRLRVDSADLEGAEVLIDGAVVGKAPWEGNLAPGAHVLFVRRAERGSPPAQVTVLEGRTVGATASLSPLGPESVIGVEPPSAEIRIDGVRLAKGTWQGRLPIGPHVIEGVEDGYRGERAVTEVTTQKAKAVSLHLQVDSDHPRWATSEVSSGVLRVDGFFGFIVSPSLEGSAEAECAEGSCGLAHGWIAGGRLSYAWPLGLAAEVGGGYLRMTHTIARSESRAFGPEDAPTQVRFALSDDLRLAGPFASVGLAYHLSLLRFLSVGARLHTGALYASATDDIRVSASSPGSPAAAYLENNGAAARGLAVLLLPSLEARFDLGRFYTSFEVGALISLVDGPANDHGELVVERGSDPCRDYPAPAACAPGQDFLANETTYGSFVALVPSMHAGLRF